MGSRCRTVALCLLTAGFSAGAGVAGVGGAAAATSRPAILSLAITSADGLPVPAAGGRVVVRVHVRDATACTFLIRRGAAPARPVGTVPCASGRARLGMPVAASNRHAAVALRFLVRAQGAGSGTVVHAIRTRQAALPPPPTASLASSVPGVPAAGGALRLTYSSTNATACTLSAGPSFWTGADPARVACNGVYDAQVPPGPAARRWTFTFTATDASGRSATATRVVTQDPPAPPTASLSAAATTVSSLGGTVRLTFASTNASTCALTVPTLASGPLAVGCNGTYDLSVPAGSGRTLTITFTATNAAGRSASATASLAQFGGSSNWSGYVLTPGTPVTQASGRWTVPAVNCAATPDGGASTWVGIGGWADTTGPLLQTGVTTECAGGAQRTYAWWELYPNDPNYAVMFTGFPVSPGDTIEASVSQSADGAWETRVDDLTTGRSGVMVTGSGWGVIVDGASSFALQGSTANLSYAGGTSAEWIVEDYRQNDSAVGFANYGTVTFTNLATSLGSWSLTADDGVELVLGGDVVSKPSAPSADGFSVSYTG